MSRYAADDYTAPVSLVAQAQHAALEVSGVRNQGKPVKLQIFSQLSNKTTKRGPIAISLFECRDMPLMITLRRFLWLRKPSMPPCKSAETIIKENP